MGFTSGRRTAFSIVVVLLLSLILLTPILASGKPPEVLISYPVDGSTFRASETIVLDASGSFDPDGKDIKVHWRSNQDGDLGYGDIIKVKLKPGSHTITCEVQDDNGEKASETRQVTILPLEPPVAVLDIDMIDVEIFEIVNFDATRSTDPDFGITEVRFTFGDGKDSGWIKSNISSHSYDFPGTYTVRLDVKDNDGLISSTNMTVTVRGRTKVEDSGNDLTVVLLLTLMVVILALFVLLMVFKKVRRRRIKVEEEQLRRRIANRTRMARKRRGENVDGENLRSARRVKLARKGDTRARRRTMQTGRKMTDLGSRPKKR